MFFMVEIYYHEGIEGSEEDKEGNRYLVLVVREGVAARPWFISPSGEEFEPLKNAEKTEIIKN